MNQNFLNIKDDNEAPELREMWRRYEFIVNTSKEFMALISRDYVYEAVNDAYCQARAQTRAEIIGSKPSDLWGDETFREVIQGPIDLCFSGQEVNYQAWYDHAALGLRYMDVTYYPYYSRKNIVSHVVVVSRDITGRERAEKAMIRYAERLETLREIDRAILEAQSPEDIAEAAIRYLRRLVPCQQARVVMFDSDLIRDRLNKDINNKNQSTEQDHNVAGNAGSNTDKHEEDSIKWRVLAEYPSHRDGEHEFEVSPDTPTLNIPLVSKGELLGTLSLVVSNPEGFSSEDTDVAREVAYQIALAIQQAQLQKALQRYNDELENLVGERTREIERRRKVAEGLHEVVSILNSSRSLDDILDYIFVQATSLLDTNAVAVFSKNPEEESTIFEFQSGHSVITAGFSQEDVEMSHALVEQTALKPETLAFSSLFNRLDFGQLEIDQQAINYQSVLSVPLIVHEHVYGVIIFYYVECKDFSADQIELATSLGDQVALAIENARLHQRAEEAGMMEERERLARELHDSVTQSLYSLTLFAEAGRRKVIAGQIDDVQGYLEQLSETSQQALKEMRLLLYELRPEVLEQDGLIGVLKKRLDAVEKRAGVDASLEVSHNLEIPWFAEEGLYRIAQEALNNALKHADADRTVVFLHTVDNFIELVITDNGVGFNPDDLKNSGGMGLYNINSRIEKLGGEFSIQSETGKGTKVIARIPISKSRPEKDD